MTINALEKLSAAKEKSPSESDNYSILITHFTRQSSFRSPASYSHPRSVPSYLGRRPIPVLLQNISNRMGCARPGNFVLLNDTVLLDKNLVTPSTQDAASRVIECADTFSPYSRPKSGPAPSTVIPLSTIERW